VLIEHKFNHCSHCGSDISQNVVTGYKTRRVVDVQRFTYVETHAKRGGAATAFCNVRNNISNVSKQGISMFESIYAAVSGKPLFTDDAQ
jgi:hypothetical protein